MESFQRGPFFFSFFLFPGQSPGCSSLPTPETIIPSCSWSHKGGGAGDSSGWIWGLLSGTCRMCHTVGKQGAISEHQGRGCPSDSTVHWDGRSGPGRGQGTHHLIEGTAEAKDLSGSLLEDNLWGFLLSRSNHQGVF